MGGRFRCALVAIAIGLISGCSSGDGDGGDDGGPTQGPDVTPPEVTATSPSDGAVGVQPDAVVTVTFSEAVTRSTQAGSAIELAPDPGGELALADRVVSFTPSADLVRGQTYTVTVGTGFTDLAGNALAAPHTFSFSTEEPDIVLETGFAPGAAWAYSFDINTTVSATSTGTYHYHDTGDRLAWVAGQSAWQGRTAWDVWLLTWEDGTGTDPLFAASLLHMSEDADGLEIWRDTTSGGEWRRCVDFNALQFENLGYFMAGGPSRDDTGIQTVSAVTVPAGTYTALLVEHHYTDTGPYNNEDIFEDRWEYWADGVGMVKAVWDYWYDDNDPRGTDIMTSGGYVLESVGAGDLPTPLLEVGTNNSYAAAQDLGGGAVVLGSVHIDDPGTVLSDAGVSCPYAQCLWANTEGELLFQDFYRLDWLSGGPVRIELAFDTYDSTNQVWNDLDLYLFYYFRGALQFRALSGQESEQEVITSSDLPVGAYIVVVQAWDTPAAPVPYALSVR